MARTWICKVRMLISTLRLKMSVGNISIEHAAMPNVEVKCGLDGCPDEYKKMNSFRKHLKRMQTNILTLAMQ